MVFLYLFCRVVKLSTKRKSPLRQFVPGGKVRMTPHARSRRHRFGLDEACPTHSPVTPDPWCAFGTPSLVGSGLEPNDAALHVQLAFRHVLPFDNVILVQILMPTINRPLTFSDISKEQPRRTRRPGATLMRSCAHKRAPSRREGAGFHLFGLHAHVPTGRPRTDTTKSRAPACPTLF